MREAFEGGADLFLPASVTIHDVDGDPAVNWKDSPIYKGSTQYDPVPGVKNVMVTGGAGFM